MKRILLSSTASLALVAWVLQASAAPPETPKPGLKVAPNGSWSELFLGGGEGATGNVISAMGQSSEFEFHAVLKGPVEVLDPLVEPYWQYKTTYVDGKLTLWNYPGTPWYNKKAPVGPYVYTGITVVNLTHKPVAPGDQFEFALVGTLFGDRVIIAGGFVGIPQPFQVIIYPEGGGPPITVDGMSGQLTTAAVNAYPMNAGKK